MVAALLSQMTIIAVRQWWLSTQKRVVKIIAYELGPSDVNIFNIFKEA